MATIDYKQKIKDYMNSSEVDTLYKSMLNNLFPELAESEDERIGKEIIDIIDSYDVAHLKAAGLPSRIPEYIAWIKKQGEHANFLSKIQVGDKVTRNKDGVLVNLSQLKRVAKKDEKQGEQKPYGQRQECVDCQLNYAGECKGSCAMKRGEQKPADKKGMNLVEGEMTPFQKKVFCIIDTAIEEEQGLKQVCDELFALASNEIKQNPAWSEEDEKQARQIERIVHNDGCTQKLQKQIADWFKSLKDRVQPQPKQEWSEEDINMIDWLIRCCEKEHEELCNDRYGHQDIVSDLKRDCRKKWDWLESLKEKVAPQKQWKPSEEQMKILNEVLNFAANHENPHWNDYIFGTLHNLIIQLKKLREK